MSRQQRIVHVALIASVLVVSWLMARQDFHMHLDNAKAAGFALRVFVDHPSAAFGLFTQVLAIAALYAAFFQLIAVLGRCQDSTAPRRAVTILVMTWLFFCWLGLRGNALSFPRSSWAWIVEPVMAQPLAWLVDAAALLFISWRIVALARRISFTHRRAGITLMAGCTTVAVVFLGGALLRSSDASSQDRGDRPNIVVVGIDSLRRDIALSGDAALIPNLSAFQRDAYVQRNVVSPLARTFPAWVTMLTGEAPSVSKIRGNLVAPGDVGARSIGWKLRAEGYRTIYATDETRFSNIGRDFGFDQIVSPQPGVADFLLGQFGDQPLINFATQIPYAELLLPSLVGNRAFAQAYRPARFIDRLADSIGPADGQATFLITHLCTAHWPYYSAKTPFGHSDYLQAVHEVDAQFGELMSRLRRLGYIDKNTVVVVLADHGEGAPELQSTTVQVVKHGTDATFEPPVGGHGGTLLDPSQWQVFLMFSGHSALGTIPAGASEQLLSLEDLADTLLQLAGDTAQQPLFEMDVVGAATNTGRSGHGPARAYVHIETGFNPKDFSLLSPDGGAALRIAETSYDVLDDGRVQLKPSALEFSVENKDYGVTDGTRVLAYVNGETQKTLVELDGATNVADLYPVARGNVGKQPALMDAACADEDMRARLPTWCTR